MWVHILLAKLLSNFLSAL